jgi:hypothetical protein
MGLVLTMTTILPAVAADARELASVLRQEDRAEVLALLGPVDPIEGPADSLLQGLASAREAWTARDAAGRIICMGGVSPLSLVGSTGVPWLLGSDLVTAHRRTFMVESRRLVARWLTLFDALRNVVDARYDAAIRWLRWLGFEIGPPFVLAHGLFRRVIKEAA